MKKPFYAIFSTCLTVLLVLSALLIHTAGSAEGSEEDRYAGTLQYTPSADGSTVTISYNLNGETVS